MTNAASHQRNMTTKTVAPGQADSKRQARQHADKAAANKAAVDAINQARTTVADAITDLLDSKPVDTDQVVAEATGDGYGPGGQCPLHGSAMCTHPDTKVTGLSGANVQALRDTFPGAEVVRTATTATFVGCTPQKALAKLDAAMAGMPTKGSPRHSLWAVRRRLLAQVNGVAAPEAPAADPQPEPAAAPAEPKAPRASRLANTHPRYQQAKARQAELGDKRGPGTQVTDGELALYIAQARTERPDTTSGQELEIAYWLANLAVSRTRWNLAWAAASGTPVVQAGKRAGQPVPAAVAGQPVTTPLRLVVGGAAG